MADYYTHISFQFGLPDERAACQAVGLLAEIEEAIEEQDKLETRFPAFKDFEMSSGVVVEAEGSDVWVRDDCGCPELEFVVSWLQEVLKRHAPNSGVGFAWSNDCTRHRLDAFGGGAVFVTSESETWTNTYDWLSEQEKAHDAKQGNEAKEATA